MKITFQHDKFALDAVPIEDHLVVLDSDFDFCSKCNSWEGSAEAVRRLRQQSLRLSTSLTISELALEQFKAAGERVLTAIEESHAEDSDLIIPCPQGINPATGEPYAYMAFQKAGIAYAVKRADTMIGDQPGLGKTIQGVGLVNCLPEARNILIISPAFLKPMWRDKFKEWDIKGLTVGIAEGVKDPVFPNTNVRIINYDILKAYRGVLRETTWDVMICDEIHKLKNSKAGRTREVFGGIKRNKDKEIIDRVGPIKTHKRVFLTGTPTLNGKPKDLWPIIQQLDPDGLGKDWYSYAKRYCGLREITRFNAELNRPERIGWWWEGSEQLEELQSIMRSKFLVRRLKKDVLKELPAKRRMIIPLAVSDRVAVRLSKEIEEFDKYVGTNDDAYFVTPQFGQMSTKLLEAGLMMVKPTIEIVKDDLEDMDKIVVMCYHLEVSRQIAAAFPNFLLINGDVPPAKRFDLAKQFQTDPKISGVVATLSAASEGLDMFAAWEMVFPERSWKPGEVEQGEDRIHRKGQLNQCLYKHLVLEGSLSERQTKMLIAKQNRADKMLDKKSAA